MRTLQMRIDYIRHVLGVVAVSNGVREFTMAQHATTALEELQKEITTLQKLLKNCLLQACWTSEGYIDHGHISCYENAQRYLVSLNEIADSLCTYSERDWKD